MPRKTTLQKIGDDLFADVDALSLTDFEKKQVIRYRHIITRRLADPNLANTALVEELKSGYSVSLSQAYRDIYDAELFFGKISTATKEWARYTFIENIKKAITMADEAGDYMGIIAGSDKLAKYMRLDKEDPQAIPYEEIVPPTIEYINDPGLLGVKVEDPEALVARIKKKYITDVEFTEIKK